jgi:hypothetical protein
MDLKPALVFEISPESQVIAKNDCSSDSASAFWRLSFEDSLPRFSLGRS